VIFIRFLLLLPLLTRTEAPLENKKESYHSSNISKRLRSLQAKVAIMKKYFGLRGQSLNWAIGTIAGCDFLLFGYGMSSSTSIQLSTSQS
jgi:uncharacterized UPF0160 family protein